MKNMQFLQEECKKGLIVGYVLMEVIKIRV